MSIRRHSQTSFLTLAILLLLSLCPTSSLKANLFLQSFECPQKVEASVLNVVSQEAPLFSRNEMVNVTLKTKKVFKGEPKEILKLLTLKHGPVRFEKGKTYLMELRNNLICSAKELKLAQN